MADVPRPILVVISGPPGAGKTTLARALAQAIPCPAISRDEIKEGMVNAHGGDFQPSPGDPLTQRTLPLFFDVLRVLLTGGVTVVAEAAFQDHVWRPRLEPLLELAELRIVQCHVDPAVAHDRAASRPDARRAVSRHAHAVPAEELEEWRRWFAEFERVSLPVPAIDVDTASGYDPALEEIVSFVRGSR